MVKPGLGLALKVRNDTSGQYLAEFDAPLIKRINVPDSALRENGVLIKSNEFAQSFRGEPLSQDRIRWPVSFEDPVGHEPIGRALSFHFVGRLAEGQRLGLGEDIGQEHVVMAAERIEWLCEGDEVAGDEPGSLMNQLIERVLPIRARLSPVDGA